LDGKSQWLDHSHNIQQRSLDAISLKLGSARKLRAEILGILTGGHNDRVLATPIHNIHDLLKLTPKSSNLIEIAGGVRNFKRRRDVPHFSRHDGCWFDFFILIEEEGKSAQIIGFDFELRFPPELSVPFIRFDLNPPGHNNQDNALRFHCHPGSDDLMVHSPAMNPLEILHLFLYGFEIPEKLRRSNG
jgi:hypothetical protein